MLNIHVAAYLAFIPLFVFKRFYKTYLYSETNTVVRYASSIYLINFHEHLFT